MLGLGKPPMQFDATFSYPGATMKNSFFILSLMLFTQAHAAGYFRSGDDLDELAKALASMGHVDKALFAKGYVAGVADATSGMSWCPTAQATEEQLYYAVAAYMKAHPESLKRGAAGIVGDALASEFPCGKK